jgi:glycerol-3-phosphate responsive antiterminator
MGREKHGLEIIRVHLLAAFESGLQDLERLFLRDRVAVKRANSQISHFDVVHRVASRAACASL